MALFSHVDCVLLKVSDLEAGLRFYSERLGHEVIWRTETAAGMRLPNSNAELVISIENGPETDFKVKNVRQAFRDLLAEGASAVVEPFEIPIGLCAVVRDPWGNLITILDTTKGLLKVDDEKKVIGNEPGEAFDED